MSGSTPRILGGLAVAAAMTGCGGVYAIAVRPPEEIAAWATDAWVEPAPGDSLDVYFLLAGEPPVTAAAPAPDDACFDPLGGRPATPSASPQYERRRTARGQEVAVVRILADSLPALNGRNFALYGDGRVPRPSLPGDPIGLVGETVSCAAAETLEPAGLTHELTVTTERTIGFVAGGLAAIAFVAAALSADWEW